MNAALGSLTERLRDPAFDPDPDRGDWSDLHAPLDEVAAAAAAVRGLAEPTAASLEDASTIGQLRALVADRLGDAAALLLAARRRPQGLDLLRFAAAFGGDGREGRLATAGLADPTRFVVLIRAWWLIGQKRRTEAVAVARSVVPGAAAALAESAQTILDAPAPISSAPGLGTLNGFGVSMYGDRDRRPDGTYVKTRFVTALFVPIVPLESYRVADGEEGGWYFAGRVPLSPAHRWWRRLLLVGLVVGLLGWGTSAYLGSEGYRLGQAIAAAQQAERDAGPDERPDVIDRYEAVVHEFPDADPDALHPVLEAFVRLSAEEVESPLTVEHLADAKRVLVRYEALPAVARHSSQVGPMLALLERWADELGTDEHTGAMAALELLDRAAALAHGEEAVRLRDRHHAMARTIALGLSDEWPLEAIRQLVALEGDQDALEAAAQLIDRLGDGPSVWIELQPAIERWIPRAAAHRQLGEIRERAEARLLAAKASAEDPQRLALLTEPDEEALATAVAASPGDQELAVALANLRMARGDLDGARTLLEGLGSPGQTVMSAQVALAWLRFESGAEAEADALLERVVTYRLPAFEQARRAFAEHYEKTSNNLVERGRKGNLPPALVAKLRQVPEADQLRVFTEWHDEQLDGDTTLARLREEVASQMGVIDAAIQWGTIKLRRAQGTAGEERRALLDGAERAFLAIATEGQGVPSFHLGLGQVYYRLDKHEQAERELANLLDDDPPEVRLAVAQVYRDLGLVARAREVALAVFEGSSSPIKEQTAQFLSVLSSDLDERRTWLERAGDGEMVRLRLVELDADERQMSGDFAEADALYARAVDFWSERATTDSTAANNAAVALFSRYDCTGDPTRLREAVTLLERSRSLDPNNGVVLGNLASAVEALATAELVRKWIHPEALLLTNDEAQSLLARLASGPMGPEVRESMAASATLRRALDLTQQEQVLAPRRTSSYRRATSWYGFTRNVEGLGAVGKRIEGVELDLSQLLESMERFERGDYDTELLQRTQRRLDHLAARLAELEDATRHEPTIAAAHFLRGRELEELATLSNDPQQARAAVESYAAAHEHWPELGARADQSDALVLLAFLEAGQSSVAMQQELDAGLRMLQTTALGVRLLAANGDALAALRRQPALAQAVEVARSQSPEHLDVSSSVLANLAGDDELAAASVVGLASPSLRLELELDRVLDGRPEHAELIIGYIEAEGARLGARIDR